MTRRQALGLLGAAAFASAAKLEFPKGAIIRTLFKDLSPESLAGGATLFHEHVSLSTAYWHKLITLQAAARGAPEPPVTPYFMEDVDLVADEVGAAKQEGIACIVDAGHADMGRSIDFLKQVSTRSGLPIVASGGYYTHQYYPPEIKTMSEDEIARLLTKQSKEERWGAFGEIGSWDDITPDEKKVFRAVGEAHLATNLPIYTHTAFGKAAEAQLDIYESVGVKPDRLVIGHVGGLVDPEVKVHKAICKRGAYVGFDRLGAPTDAAQVPMVQALIDAGYAEKILLASDFYNPRHLKKNGGPGYAKTVTVFGPLLRKAGVKEEIIQQMYVDNPRRFLAFVPKS